MNDDHILGAFRFVSARRRQLVFILGIIMTAGASWFHVVGVVTTLAQNVVLGQMILNMLALFLVFVWVLFLAPNHYKRRMGKALWSVPRGRRWLLTVTAVVVLSVIVTWYGNDMLALWGARGKPMLDIVVGPFIEEFVFRFALLYSIITLVPMSMARSVPGGARSIGVAFAAVAFGVIHPWDSVWHVLLPMVWGVWFSLLVMKYGSLLPPYLAHMAVNAVVYVG